MTDIRKYKMKKRPIYESFKRAFDVFCSALGIIGTSPIWLFAVIGIELSDPGPVFYMARRVGKDNEEFRMYKFRSMRVDCGADETGFKADINRIFKFGELIRRLKIDELPQLLNILKGDMSIVGPRPASIDQVEIVRAGINKVASYVKPGLTGPSALYDYIYGDTIEDEAEYEEKVLPTRLELDVYYVRRRCSLFDIQMIWWTVICIIHSLMDKDSEHILNTLIGWSEKNKKMTDRHRRKRSWYSR